MQTGLHRNTISKVYRQLEIDGVVGHSWIGIYVRDNVTKEILKNHFTQSKISNPPNEEAKKAIDKLINLDVPYKRQGKY